MAIVNPDSRVLLRPLAIRESDDEPGIFVVGRAELGDFVELPDVGVAALRLLGQGLPVAEVEERLSRDADRPDVTGLLYDLLDLHWIAALDDEQLPDPDKAAPTQVRWLRSAHLRWLFSRPVAWCLGALVLVTAVTVLRQPELLPGYRDFFWTDYVGVATLVNTLLFVAGALVHEVMHLGAARSLGLPARIGLGTRLSNLTLQTDVSAAWAVPRRQRYRIYLAGMAWDLAGICTALLICAYGGPSLLVRQLLTAYVLVTAGSMVLQAQIYMRTDLYFVVMDLLRCGDLFHDGLAYARYLVARLPRALLRRPASNPAAALPAKEWRAVRIYAPLVVVGSATALAAYAAFAIPILVETSVRAIAEITAHESAVRVLDGGLVLVVEWGLQILFLVTFYRSHPAWFGWGRRLIGRR